MAEYDLELLWSGAVVRQRRAVVRVRERGRALALEVVRVRARPARLGTVVHVPTAQLVRPERRAPALAPDDTTPVRRAQLQRAGAVGEQVLPATDDGTAAFPFVRGDGHGDVEAVDEGDAVGGEVLAGPTVVEGELGESGGRGAAEAAALEAGAAVAGRAGEVGGGAGGGATGAGPNAAGPVTVGCRE